MVSMWHAENRRGTLAPSPFSPLAACDPRALLVHTASNNSCKFAEKPPVSARMTLGRAAYGPREDRVAAQGVIHAEPKRRYERGRHWTRRTPPYPRRPPHSGDQAVGYP